MSRSFAMLGELLRWPDDKIAVYVRACLLDEWGDPTDAGRLEEFGRYVANHVLADARASLAGMSDRDHLCAVCGGLATWSSRQASYCHRHGPGAGQPASEPGDVTREPSSALHSLDLTTIEQMKGTPRLLMLERAAEAARRYVRWAHSGLPHEIAEALELLEEALRALDAAP